MEKQERQERQAQPFAPRKERGMDSFRRTARRGARRSRGMSPLLAVLKGVIVAASVTVLGVVLFALALNWWNAGDRAVTAVNQVVKFVSILAGVASAMSMGEGASPLRGAAVGLAYMALGVVCYCVLMGQSIQPAGYLADLGMGLAAGGLFGMILAGQR